MLVLPRRLLPFLALALSLCGLDAVAGERPNILFVLTDDQAPWALGASGNEQALTPNMDRLAREGTRLSRCFTPTPVCSPSRASLMSSRYGSELGIVDWIHPGREPELGLDPESVCWPELLRRAGYRTGLVGKWHLGVPDRFHPSRLGFEEFFGFRTGGAPTANAKLEGKAIGDKGPDGKVEIRVREGLTADVLTDHALDFIERHREATFLLSLHYRAPHTRWLPVADEDMAPYLERELEIPNAEYPDLDTRRVQRMMREYLASCRSVDRNLGRVLAKLDELDLAKGTLVVFTSDHGYNMGHNGIWHKGNGHWVLTKPPPATENIPKNQRPNLYDNSLLVPTMLRWPEVIPAGRVVDRTVSMLDWFPTLLAAAEVDLPEGLEIRGRDALGILRGEKVDGWIDGFYAEYSTRHQSKTHMRAYRTNRWKLVRDLLNPERDELFDLVGDPAESINRIDEDTPHVRRIIAELDRKIRQQMRANGDPVEWYAHSPHGTKR